MANPSPFLLCLTATLLVLHATAQSTAPSPSPSNAVNITGILEKAGGYSFFIRMLKDTQAGNQINEQAKNSNDGVTVFAPTDNAFNNLPGGTLNKLSSQQKVQLVQYHVLPKFYTFDDLLSVSNPVRTQATGQDGGIFGLNFTGQNNQVNVSTGVVETQVYNALRKDMPMAVYQIDKVLLPLEFTQAKAPTSSPPSTSNSTRNADSNTPDAPSPADSSDSTGISVGMGLGLMSTILVFCMGFIS